MVKQSSGAKSILKECGASALAEAILKAEGVPKVTATILVMMGLGIPTLVLSECTTAESKAKSRREISAALLAEDEAALLKEYGGKGTLDARKVKALTTISRLVAAVVEEALYQKEQSLSVAAAPAAGDQKSNLVLQQESEEDRGYVLTEYRTNDVKTNVTVVLKMYNLRLRQHFMPTHHVMKCLAHWWQVEQCWPDPARLPLSKFKRDADDTALLLFKRLVYGVLVVAAGAGVPAGIRDDGAGNLRKHVPQWANGNQLNELLLELEECQSKMDEATTKAVTTLMHVSMHKSTTRSGESVSLAAARQMSKVAEYVAAQSAKGGDEEGRSAKRRKSDKGGATADGKRKGDALSTPEKKRKGAQADTPRTLQSGSKKYPDEVGAKGPNGLERMKGGNPAGDPCRDLAKGKCAYASCSFSHAK